MNYFVRSSSNSSSLRATALRVLFGALRVRRFAVRARGLLAQPPSLALGLALCIPQCEPVAGAEPQGALLARRVLFHQLGAFVHPNPVEHGQLEHPVLHDRVLVFDDANLRDAEYLLV